MLVRKREWVSLNSASYRPSIALDGKAPPCERQQPREATMALWRWLVGLFRRKPVDPLPADERRFVDARATNAANAAKANIGGGGVGLGPS